MFTDDSVICVGEIGFSPTIRIIVGEWIFSPSQNGLSSENFLFTDGKDSIVGEKPETQNFTDDSTVTVGELNFRRRFPY
ncbi:hypothetical protein [Nosocomiicoccus massiliensis]|uniref:Uncharacterized protein n=1 Tax=Nosocomiicoccus massiliensis TaxID=1232430 RepID=A0AAF0YIL2_9STAP|nr:hypothetical protein [Nosocomiicoccus massiliensis]WOS96221.1 hypothetical protein CJ229_000325 [Nosocomiicoccus massiliensis]